MRSLLTTLFLTTFLATACGDGEGVPLDARRAFRMTTELVHSVHEVAYFAERKPIPEQYAHTCSGGGKIDMTTTATLPGSRPFDLMHTFVECAEEDVLMNGQLDYIDIQSCSFSNNFVITMRGAMRYSGAMSGECELDVQETCTGVEGTACGEAL